MTLTLELTGELEARLINKARELGIEPAEYVFKLLDQNTFSGLMPGESLLDGLKRIGVVGIADGKERLDGRPWSEVEGFE